jgi:hypothetical protein
MSINILVGKDRVEVGFIEWRPGEGLVLRVTNKVTETALEGLKDGLYAALRGSPCAIYRTCCDSTPGYGHMEGCLEIKAEAEA